jgi:TorA maturation chaperone TorD
MIIYYDNRTNDIIITEYLNHRKAIEKTTEEDIMDTVSVCTSNKRNECSRSQQLEDTRTKSNNILEEVFPWLPKFNKIIRSATKNKNYQNLERLIVLYTQ